jgi:hypothetical protein
MVERILARTSSRETQSVVTSRRRVRTRSRAMSARTVDPISVTADSFRETAIPTGGCARSRASCHGTCRSPLATSPGTGRDRSCPSADVPRLGDHLGLRHHRVLGDHVQEGPHLVEGAPTRRPKSVTNTDGPELPEGFDCPALDTPVPRRPRLLQGRASTTCPRARTIGGRRKTRITMT